MMNSPVPALINPAIAASSESALDKRSILTKLTLLAIIVLAILVRLMGYLHNRSLWLDEAMLSQSIVRRPLTEIFMPLDLYQVAPTGFLLIAKAGVILFGNSELALRLVPMLCGIISVPLFFLLCRRCLGTHACLVAMILFGFSTPLIYYSSEIKPYGCDVFFTLVLFLLGFRVLDLPSTRRMLLLAFSGAFAIWLSFPTVFVLAGISTISFVNFAYRKQFHNAFLMAATSGIWTASFLINYLAFGRTLTSSPLHQISFGGSFVVFPPHSTNDLVRLGQNILDVFRNVIRPDADLHFPKQAIFLFLVVLLFSTSIFLLKQARRPHFIAMLLSVIPFVLVASWMHKFPIAARLCLFLTPIIIICATTTIDALIAKNSRILRYAGCAAAMIIIIVPLCEAAFRIIHPMDREEVKAALHLIYVQAHDGDVLIQNSLAEPAFDYYYLGYGEQRPTRPILRVNYRLLDSLHVFEGGPAQIPGNAFASLTDLHGQNRVWILFVNNMLPAAVEAKQDNLNDINRMATQFGEWDFPGVTVYLYSFNK